MDTILLPDGSEMELEDLVAEYVRLREWCAACLGEDVAKVGGLQVNPKE